MIELANNGQQAQPLHHASHACKTIDCVAKVRFMNLLILSIETNT